MERPSAATSLIRSVTSLILENSPEIIAQQLSLVTLPELPYLIIFILIIFILNLIIRVSAPNFRFRVHLNVLNN